MIIFYLTATGNSLAVAKRIGGELISIPQVIDSENLQYKDDAIGLVFPIYGWRIPKMVHEFLKKVKLEADYTFAIGTYGNLAGAAMLNLQKHAKTQGFQFDYTADLLMVDNALPAFEIGNQIAKLPKKKTEENTAKIVQDIHNRKVTQTTASMGMRALTSAIGLFDNLIFNGKQGQGYIIDEKCNKCGICAKVCPVKNITVTDKVEFSDHCIGCQACVHQCSQNAIHVKKEKSAKRWRNPEVSLKEIIQANNQEK